MNNKTVVVAFGGNIGSVLQYFRHARSALDEMNDCMVCKSSPVYQSSPLGVDGQDDYLNAVVCIKTRCPAKALLSRFHDIENSCGRIRSVRWGARTLDLDMIDYAGEIVCSKTLTLPHPEAQFRAFVLLPLGDIMPTWQHPVLQKTPQQLLFFCDCQGIQCLSNHW